MLDFGVYDGNDVETAGLTAQTVLAEIAAGHGYYPSLLSPGYPSGGMAKRGSFGVFDLDKRERPVRVLGDAVDFPLFRLEIP